MFFIQDGIKLPDIIHAGKPHPDREIPQDRGIPRSFRTMEGFGVHTFRLVNDKGEASPRQHRRHCGG